MPRKPDFGSLAAVLQPEVFSFRLIGSKQTRPRTSRFDKSKTLTLIQMLWEECPSCETCCQADETRRRTDRAGVSHKIV